MCKADLALVLRSSLRQADIYIDLDGLIHVCELAAAFLNRGLEVYTA